MSSWLPLEVFPAGGLGSPVITTVWIGVLVLAFFNLRLGWVFIGLVVPGYLVPLLISKPWSAVVIVVEAVLTYVIVYSTSERLRLPAGWSSLFGRDRFFAFILVSVAVRLILDGYLLPPFAVWLQERTGAVFDFQSELHSFGLIIVALLANQFWKPGLATGLAQLVVTTGLTFAIVRFGLMEWTNFGLGGLEYAYEDTASSILASPKAYIVLVTTAFIASRLNLLYGWEYSGILIPALLALQWYQPTKLVASVVEAWVVLAAGALVLQTPFFQRRTIERASKVVLFFTLSYLYKFGLAFALSATEVKVSDAYGFGYLLPSLLAVKMHEKRIGLRMTRFTVQTTLVSAAAALVVGFALSLVAVPLAGTDAEQAGASREVVKRQESLAEIVEELRVQSYRGRFQGSYRRPTPLELRGLRRAGELLDRYAVSGEEELRPALLSQAAALDLRVEEIEGKFLLLREEEPPRGWGFTLLRRGSSKGMLLQTPRSVEEWPALPVALRLLERLEARGILSSGAAQTATSDGAADVLGRSGTPFLELHRVLAQGDVLQIRGRDRSRSTDDEAPTRLQVRGRMPETLDLRFLETSLGEYPVIFGDTAQRNIPRESAGAGFAELFLDDQGARALLRAREQPARTATDYDLDIEGYLQGFLRGGRERIAPRGSDAYVPPTLEELLFLDEEVLTPLLREVRPASRARALGEDAASVLSQVRRSAALIGYEVIWYRHRATGNEYLVLQEGGEAPRHWGTYVLRLGSRSPFLIEVPRPLFERNTFEIGLDLFERTNAEALLIGGAHPYANRGGEADLVHTLNQRSAFNLVQQTLMREAGDAHQLAVVLRAFAREEAWEIDAMVAFSGAIGSAASLGPTATRLIDQLRRDGRRVAFVDGAPATAGYEVANLAQARYLEQTRNKQLAALWLSVDVREQFRQPSETRLQTTAVEVLGLEARTADLQEVLSEGLGTELGALPRLQELLHLVRTFLASADVVALERIRSEWSWADIDRVADLSSGQEYLVLSQAVPGGAQPRLAINLQATGGEVQPIEQAADLRAALSTRHPILLLGGAR